MQGIYIYIYDFFPAVLCFARVPYFCPNPEASGSRAGKNIKILSGHNNSHGGTGLLRLMLLHVLFLKCFFRDGFGQSTTTFSSYFVDTCRRSLWVGLFISIVHHLISSSIPFSFYFKFLCKKQPDSRNVHASVSDCQRPRSRQCAG